MKLGIIMDPISKIDIKKDSSFAMLLAAQKRDWNIFYMTLDDLYMDNSKPKARMRKLKVNDDPKKWYVLSEDYNDCLSVLDVILMRKDPPFNLEYIYSTYILEYAQRLGVLVSMMSPETMEKRHRETERMQVTIDTLVSDVSSLKKMHNGSHPKIKGD